MVGHIHFEEESDRKLCGVFLLLAEKKEKMPLKVVEATVSSFDGVFEKFRSEAAGNKANLILFLADNDPATSLSWCPGIYVSIHACPFSSFSCTIFKSDTFCFKTSDLIAIKCEFVDWLR